MINPVEDGQLHLNIYSAALTDVGKLLSNFANTPFICEDGSFQSIEGYWYYLLSDSPQKEKLRNLYGFQAKKIGRELITNSEWSDENWFKAKILNALLAKLEQNPHIKKLLIQSHLPFKHYYVYNGKVVEPQRGKWILEFWELIRYELQLNE